MKVIRVAQPVLDGNEREYVLDALDRGAISGYASPYIEQFEQGFAGYCGCSHGIAVSTGTAALHLALAAIGIGPGDEVLVATMTNMATFFAVHYLGATPIPLDIETDTLNLDPALLETKITPRTRAILVVHLFGHPVDMDPVMNIAAKHDLLVIEDCAEAHGAEYRGKKVGNLGHIGCFSFYANKIITTGEGGMCTTNDAAVAEKMRSLRSLAFGTANKFMHSAVGFSYRMTNLQAAIGCAQMEKIETFIGMKRSIAAHYNELLQHSPELQLPVEKEYARNVYWMYHVILTGRAAHKRTELMRQLADNGIETRETFIPYNMQENLPVDSRTQREDCPNANSVALRGLYLPSGPVLDQSDIAFVAERLLHCINSL
jgi:perosamine synthetase